MISLIGTYNSLHLMSCQLYKEAYIYLPLCYRGFPMGTVRHGAWQHAETQACLWMFKVLTMKPGLTLSTLPVIFLPTEAEGKLKDSSKLQKVIKMLSNEWKIKEEYWNVWAGCLQLTQDHGIWFAPFALILLDKRRKGHSQDVLALPRALTGSGDLSQLQCPNKFQTLISKAFYKQGFLHLLLTLGWMLGWNMLICRSVCITDWLMRCSICRGSRISELEMKSDNQLWMPPGKPLLCLFFWNTDN